MGPSNQGIGTSGCAATAAIASPCACGVNAAATALPVQSTGARSPSSQRIVAAVSVVLTVAGSRTSLTPSPQASQGMVVSRGSSVPCSRPCPPWSAVTISVYCPFPYVASAACTSFETAPSARRTAQP